MAITYPLTMPSEPSLSPFTNLTVTAMDSVAVTESPFTFKQQAQVYGGKKLQIQITLPPMKLSVAAQWVAFLTALKGREGTFYCGDLSRTTPQGPASGLPLVNGAHSVSANSLSIKGFTAGITGVLKAGDYIQLGTGSSSRLYQNLQDIDSDVSGNAVADIWPDLRAAAADNDVIVVSGAKGVFRLTSNQRSWSVQTAAFWGIDFTAVEAL